ncbi:peptidase [Halomonas binhaiensis]|uniref:Peptidase n=1 Tax=Halomonas binhaiensis TaxID=2562282 RepID=A0A5C1NK13_9GAMM|nr:peptidase [Halomonas binhaiensis]QEM82139.1 peptidase [Halomonas binhaiensis]
MNLHNSIHNAIQVRRDEYTRLLQAWVRDVTLSGQEAVHQNKIHELYRSLGLDTDMWEIDVESLRDNPLFNSHREDFTGSPNIVGIWRGEGGGRSLILNGHVDVVPEGDHDQWQLAPYSGEVIDGCLYGRGVTDMKGGNLASYIAVATLKELGIRLKGDVILQSVIEEEAGGAGTLACLERGYRADAALIPEPTEQKIFPRQQGSRWFRLRVAGIKAHGGTRYEGVSALEKSVSVIQAIQRLEVERNAALDDPLYEGVPIPLPINIGRIQGGDWPSSVPDEITLEGRIGIGPGETVAQAEAELTQAMAALADVDSWFLEHPVEIEWFGACWQPGGIGLDNPLVEMLTTAFRDVHGKEPQVQASPWGTDGGLMTQYGIPALVFGPGITRLAHFPNEHIRLDDVFAVAEIMALTMIQWCQAVE